MAWERPETETKTIAGGFVLLRSHALLLLWQCFADGLIELRDMRTALAEAEVLHSQKTARRLVRHSRSVTASQLSRDLDAERVRALTDSSDIRKTRRSMMALANSGCGGDVLITRTSSTLPQTLRIARDVKDRPVPVPRRWLRSLAREGTGSEIAVSMAMLIRGAFYVRGNVRLGGTCAAAWVATTFGIDERTVKATRHLLVGRGWVTPHPSPTWHRQRFGQTFVINDTPFECRGGVPNSPPRRRVSEPVSPPPRKNENLPFRGTENQNRSTGFRSRSDKPAPPTIADVRMEDLTQPERTQALHADAVRRGLAADSPADRLRVFTTAQHAHRNGKDPCALFAALARRRCWHHGTLDDEDHARAALTRLERPNAPPTTSRGGEAKSTKPTGPVPASLVVRDLLATVVGGRR
jgi:hypothetical protein